MGEFKYFTIGVCIAVILLGAIAGSVIGALSGGPPSPVPTQPLTSQQVSAANQDANKQHTDTAQPASNAASPMAKTSTGKTSTGKTPTGKTTMGKTPVGKTRVGKSSRGEPGVVRLAGMPAGAVRVWRNSQGRLEAKLAVYGLTPGSAHNAAIDGPASTALSPEVRFPAFSADRMGRANVTLTARTSLGALASGSRFDIRLGTYPSRRAAGDKLAEELIAGSGILPARPHNVLSGLHPRSYGLTANYQGRLHGWAKIAYSPSTQTLSVTVTAYGLPPGTHAAHIHLGSCQNQGAVKYMLMDFHAGARGDIVNQTRTVRPVTPAPPTTGWYLNLHLGNNATILAKGMPTVNFRPELCAGVAAPPGAG